jgi:hypothetical protein
MRAISWSLWTVPLVWWESNSDIKWVMNTHQAALVHGYSKRPVMFQIFDQQQYAQ